MTTPTPTVADLADLAEQIAALRDIAETGIDLATRLDTVEHDLGLLLTRVDTLATLTALGTAPTPDVGVGYRYPTLAGWVDEVFARLAARHQARWCSRWDTHLEAVDRLALMWHTWETAHTAPANHHARDEWTRVIFDHHTPWLLDREGPFAGCTTERCAPAPGLQQRPLARPAATVVASLDARRRGAATAAGGAR